jgi:pyruvate/2-oxoglutarate dehydrogenase complex dihydrolipoamide acyltransferase (E2) component
VAPSIRQFSLKTPGGAPHPTISGDGDGEGSICVGGVEETQPAATSAATSAPRFALRRAPPRITGLQSKILADYNRPMRVRVCVDCGEEYRPEIESCADCGGRLEDRDDEEMASPPSAPAEEELEAAGEDEPGDSVMHAERAPSLTTAADRLAQEGIAFRIRPGEHGYDLRVAAADRDRALGLHAESGRAGECPACETPLPAGAVECPECGLAAGDDPDPE